MVYFEILCDRMLLMSTQVHSSYIHWYTKKTLGTTLLTLEKYVLISSSIYDFPLFFLIPIMSIFKSVFQRVYVCIYYSIYFFREYESSFVSGPSTNNWILKFSLTQTKRKCKTFRITWLCKIQIE